MKNNLLSSVFVLGMILLYSIPAKSQDLDALLEKEAQPQTTYATATFKSTRIVNGHSVQQMKKKQLEFRVSHRFGELNSGSYNFWGLDQGTIHLDLEYGLTDWLEFGIGRSTYEKTADAFAKVSILRQSSGVKNMPIQLSYMASTEIIGLNTDPAMQKNFTSRMSFVNQILIARKFNESLSLQLTPTFIHRNLVPTEVERNDLFAMGVGGRYKLSKRIALNVEYYYVYRANANSLPVTYYNPLSVGIDIETGGHVFQIMLTNSVAMREGGFIGKTTGSWTDAGIHLGFNISRVFSFNK
ncbi:MAG TPA: DUF5777 family beta-barrel protein [Prolixibacteraceae bacterium]|nr:DUF5777 family beta-barrel protein [Prolixibacteraceae bacterium]